MKNMFFFFFFKEGCIGCIITEIRLELSVSITMQNSTIFLQATQHFNTEETCYKTGLVLILKHLEVNL